MTSTNDAQLVLRLPQSAVDRAEQLIFKLRTRTEFQAWNVTRAGVLRLAVLRGLEALEALPAEPGTPAAEAKPRKRTKRAP